MESNAPIQINEEIIDGLREQMIQSFQYMLNIYLHQYDKYANVDEAERNEKSKENFYTKDISFLNKNGKINWEIIRRIMPFDIEKKLREEYSSLSINEIRLCCLLFFEVSHKDIAEILPYHHDSIRVISFRIREKTGIKDFKKMFRIFFVNKALTR